MWSISDSEHFCAIKPNGAHFGIILMNNISVDSLKESFDRMDFKLVD